MINLLRKDFQEAMPILEQLEAHQYKAYFVGGCVRDFLLKRQIGDIDIATSASPKMVQEIFAKVIPVGVEHGTVIVRHNHGSYEVTTFRVDGTYSDQRHPDSVEFIDKIDEDLKRRDFTINAFAMGKDGKIIDLFGGREDLDRRLIRTVGDGRQRFQEDPLRIIRAVRFVSQLGFSIDPETLEAMRQVKQEIEHLAVERLANEMAKLFAGNYLGDGIAYIKRTGLYYYLPVLREASHIIHRIPDSLQPLSSFGEVIALFHLLEPGQTVERWSRAWKCSNKVRQEAKQLVEAIRYFMENGLDEWLVYRLDNAYFYGFIHLINNLKLEKTVNLSQVQELAAKLPIESKRDLAIKGHEIAAIFPDFKKGPWLKRLIQQLEEEVVRGRVKNTTFELKEWIQCNPPETD
ncbi:CCA tRNA nucleotidyltransferase [Lentibacillus sediminis]|uniref:CCA tRNA nucleotidyltransferase n=1 Tax=Lentibacillus sediminis TaxID=1940529 RepID=UPI001EFD4AAE|nr:CCA tRNA nucleotidyltransferase [Lentibacillus sediminis]